MDCHILHREELLKLSDYFMVLSKTIIQKMEKLHLELVKPIQILINASKVFKNSGTKKEVENDLLSCLAPLMRLESSI